MQEENLMHVSTGEPTYWPGDRRKVPDLLDFSVTKRIPAHSIQAEAGFDLSSDHSPVLITMHTRITPQTCPPTLSTKTTDWETFRNYINENLTLKVPLKTMCITSYKPYGRLPGPLRRITINTPIRTPVLLH
jgi:hypothetical protein